MSTTFLHFEGWAVFTDTYEPYRKWLVLKNVPEHGLQRGHVLLEVGPGTMEEDGEDPLWDGLRWQARTKPSSGKVITELEEWQVAPLFGGEIPPWPMEGAILQTVRGLLKDLLPMGKKGFVDATKCMAKMIELLAKDLPAVPPEEEGRIPVDEALVERYCLLTAVEHERENLGVVFYAEEAVDGTPVRAGDFVFYRWGESRIEARRGARVFTVPRSHLAAAGVGIDAGTLRPILVTKHKLWRETDAQVVEGCRGKLAKPQRPNWKDSTSPLIIVRPPLAPTVSEPIQATSDDAALFELIHQVGGTMPKETNR